jgi:hypothetical protein
VSVLHNWSTARGGGVAVDQTAIKSSLSEKDLGITSNSRLLVNLPP